MVWWKGQRHGPALALYVAMSVGLFSSTWWGSPRSHFIGVRGDPQLVMWFLSWTPHALTHGLNPLFTHHLNYPDGVNLMWNTLMPLAGVALWPITRVLGPVFAFNVLVTLALPISAFAAYLALLRYVTHRSAAFIGGVLYGFSPYMINQAYGHANLILAPIP